MTILIICVAILFLSKLDNFAQSGQRCFVDVFGFMHVCVLLPNADGGGICTCRVYCVAKIWGFQMAKDLDDALMFLIFKRCGPLQIMWSMPKSRDTPIPNPGEMHWSV